MIEFIVISASVSALTILDKLGKISVNNNVIKIIICAYLMKISYQGIDQVVEVFLLKP